MQRDGAGTISGLSSLLSSLVGPDFSFTEESASCFTGTTEKALDG